MYLLTQGISLFEISLFVLAYFPLGNIRSRGPKLRAESPPGVPSSIPWVACSYASPIIRSASSIILSASSPTVFVPASLFASVTVSFAPPSALPPVAVFPPQDTRSALAQRVSVRAAVIMIFFISYSNAVLSAGLFCGAFAPLLYFAPKELYKSQSWVVFSGI